MAHCSASTEGNHALETRRGATYRLLRGLPHVVVLENGLVQGVQQVRRPNDVPRVRRDLGYPGAEDSVQHLQLPQSGRQLVHHDGESYCGVCEGQGSHALARKTVQSDPPETLNHEGGQSRQEGAAISSPVAQVHVPKESAF